MATFQWENAPFIISSAVITFHEWQLTETQTQRSSVPTKTKEMVPKRLQTLANGFSGTYG